MEDLSYNYFLEGIAITKKSFEENVPENWKGEVDEFGEYTYGYYRANEK